MSGSLGELYAELTLRTDKLKQGVASGRKELEALEKSVAEINDRINAKIADIGKVLSLSITAPMALFAKASISTFSSFEQAMQNTYSVMNATQAEMDALREKAEVMGAKTRFSASQAADALYSLGQSGQTAAQAISSLDGVLQLAGATGSDLAYTSDTITATLSQFNLDAREASRVADVFSQAISGSQASMTKLAYSMKYVGPIASGLNMSLETSTAALMNLYNTGFGGEQAGTVLRSALQTLASGSDDVKKKLKELGLSFEEVNPMTNNFADILDRMKDAGMGVAEANKLFGDAASAGMSKLISMGGDAIRTMDTMLMQSEGMAAHMQEIQNTSFANTVDEFSSALEAVQITLTGNIMPAIDIFVQGLTKALTFINELPVGIQVAGTTLGTFAALTGPLLLVAVAIKKIKAEMAMLNVVTLQNPLFLAGAGIAAGVAVFTGAMAQMKKAHQEFVTQATRGWDEIKQKQDDAVQAGDKGRNINKLVDEYETLKSKTSLTADEQARYNEILTELQTLVPDVISLFDEQGNALEINSEKARKHAQAMLETEQIYNNMALAEAKLKKAQAEAVLAQYSDEKLESAKKKADELTASTELLTDAKRKMDLLAGQYAKDVGKTTTGVLDPKQLEEYQAKADEILKTLPEKVQKQIAGFKQENSFFSMQAYKDFVRVNLENNQRVFEKENKELQEILRIQQEHFEALQKVAETESRGEIIEKGLGELAKGLDDTSAVLTTHKAEVDRVREAWEAYSATLDDKAKAARNIGEEFDKNAESFQFLQQQIKALFNIPAEAFKEKLGITDETEGMKELIALMWKYKDAQDKAGGKGAGSSTKEEREKTYKEQLTELDDYYALELKKAQNNKEQLLEIEEEYRKARIVLIDKFIAEEAKKGKGIVDAQYTETDKGSGVTLFDEKQASRRIGSGFAQYLLQEQERIRKLEKELVKLTLQLEETEEVFSEADPDSQAYKIARERIEALKNEIIDLNIEINNTDFSRTQIDDILTNLEKVGTSEIKQQLKDAQKLQIEQYKAIEEAKKNKQGKFAGVIDEKEIQKIENEYKKLADKQYNYTRIAMAGGLLDGIMGVADSLVGIIAGAIEQGGLDGASALKASGQLATQIGAMIPGVGGIITQTVGGALGLIGSIIDAQQQAAQRRVDAFNEQQRQALEEWEAYADKVASGFASKVTKSMGTGFVTPAEYLKNLDYELETRRYENFLKDIENKNATLMKGSVSKVKDGKDEKTVFGESAYKIKEIIAQIETLNKPGGFDTFVKQFADNARLLAGYTSEARDAYLSLHGVDLDVASGVNKAIEELKQGGAAKALEMLQTVLTESIEQAASLEGIDIKKFTGLSTFADNFDTALGDYIRTKDLTAFKSALKNNLRKSIVDKVVNQTIVNSLKDLFNEYEDAKDKQDALNKIMTEGVAIAESAASIAEKMAGALGLASDEINTQTELWEKIGQTMSDSLTSALGESAYTADWGNFKRAFASEMKKAIVQSTIESAGIKNRVNAIIESVTSDGEITASEITSTINALKGIYDGLEKDMSEFARITQALDGDISAKVQQSGSIIQHLSGADRDWFTEVFRDGFSKINQVIDLKETTIQHLAATQLIINSLQYVSNNGIVNIYANEGIDLRDLITEIIKEVLT